MDNQDNNKSAWNEPFYQTRSIGKCLSIGISFLSNRFLQIMKLALPVICILALFTTIVVYVRCDASLEYSIGQTLLFKVFATVAMTVAVAFVAAFVYRCVDVNIEGLNVYSVGYKYLYNKRFFNNVIIALIVSAIFVIVAVCLYLLASLLIQWIGPNENASMVQGGFSITHIAVGAGAVLLFVAVTVPLYMAISVMMLERNGIFTDLKRGYVLGWKKWGRVFALEMLVVILILIAALFVMAPAYVLSLMQHSATLSRMQGDAVDIPAYFSVITIGSLFISSLVMSVFMLCRYLPHAYLYAMAKLEENDEETVVTKS